MEDKIYTAALDAAKDCKEQGENRELAWALAWDATYVVVGTSFEGDTTWAAELAINEVYGKLKEGTDGR